MALTKREVDMSIQYFGSDTFYSAMQAYCEEMGVTTEELAAYIATTPGGEEFEFDICDAFLMGRIAWGRKSSGYHHLRNEWWV